MANAVTIPEEKLWHRRFGHYHAAGLLQLQKGDVTKDLPNIGATEKVCGVCQLGKMARQTFPTQTYWRANQKLALIHLDICGPMSENSMNENRYLVYLLMILPG